ncbi:YkgJ family cysteine cluster protein [Enhygromyxa salina]|uniref:Flagellin N-methylase n=1 Tax=Enhygromyxa salina TaxID=215803 RepID=A0A2S9YY72_9BACT|nr:YkgJ family cysteine cluster protein [Enhygromyxa salina]PRQ10045.1 Flagellin N-methylase [Enhygromyxa salina]
MVRLRVVDEDGRSSAQRGQDLHRARDRDEARENLAAVLAPLREAQRCVEAAVAKPGRATPSDQVFDLLDRAYAALDLYLADLLNEAAIDPACGPRCSACCTDLPPILPIEALRMVRSLRAQEGGPARLQRAVEQARAFQRVLLAHTGPQPKLDGTEPGYREAQLAWRRLGHPCPVLGDDGNCSAYEARPLSCRAHVHVEDPAHCEPNSPRFLIAERPPVWGHPRECEVELALATISKLLELPAAPNLQWGLALFLTPT